MKNNIRQELIKILGETNLRFNEPMTEHTTFGIGGPTDILYVAKKTDDLIKAVKLCRQLKIPFFILGGGSNVLVSDKGIRGMVIKVQNSKCPGRLGRWQAGRRAGKVQNSNIFAEAGCLLAKLINTTIENSLTGLEMLAGIPGTLGGAIVGNAGTKHGSISQVVEKVTVLGQDNKIYDLDGNNCQFDYRSSRFKKSGEVILSALLKLEKSRKELIKEEIKKILKERKTQPKGKSAGCIFKNPRLANAGYLIENAGFKGKRIGEVMVSESHANYIVNTGKATCSDVLKLISLIKEKVWKEFKVRLEEEVVIVGEL